MAARGRKTIPIFNRLLKLPDETMVFPAHDYKGDTVSTIGEEKRYNPRLQVRSVDEYVELMNNLNLPNPKLMDVVVPANMHVGLHQDDLARQGLALTARDAHRGLGRPDLLLVDLRETANARGMACCRARFTRPIPRRRQSWRRRHVARVAAATGRRIVFFVPSATLGDGSRRGQRRRPRQHRAYRRRHRRLEKSRRTGPDGLNVLSISVHGTITASR